MPASCWPAPKKATDESEVVFLMWGIIKSDQKKLDYSLKSVKIKDVVKHF